MPRAVGAVIAMVAYRKRLGWLAIAMATACAGISGPALSQTEFRIFVEPGNQGEAQKYYERISNEVGFTVIGSTLSGLLQEAGYTITADNLELLTPDELAAVPGVIAARFFAPKIVDVSKPPDQRKIGWRKLVRLKTKPKANGGGLATRGIGSVFVLFNTFTDLSTGQIPFDKENRSQNTQIMLIREGNAPGLQDPAYWIVYGAKGEEIRYLTASFDARTDPDLRPYYVPDACAQCHGGRGRVNPQGQRIFPVAGLNLLDTDHWFDRVAPSDDFPTLAASKYGVLFDAGGNDQNTPAFAKAFDTIRQLNTEIRDQNKAASPDPAKPSLQLRAVQNWLDRHTSTRFHLAPIDRPLPPLKAGDPQWTKNASPDEELLPLLNRYCYRCHSSIRYNVFDKRQVIAISDTIVDKISNPPAAPEMPQDRVLDPTIRNKLIDLLGKLPQ